MGVARVGRGPWAVCCVCGLWVPGVGWAPGPAIPLREWPWQPAQQPLISSVQEWPCPPQRTPGLADALVHPAEAPSRAQCPVVPSGAQWCPVGKRARDEAVELRSSQSPVGMGPRGNVPGLVRNTT